MRTLGILAGIAVVAAIVGCSEPAPEQPAQLAQSTQMDWYQGLAPLCGQTFVGTVVANEPAGADPAWESSPVLLHWRACEDRGMVLQFARGDDRSLSVLLGLHPSGLYLRHVVHGEDGQPADVTNFGGQGRVLPSGSAVEFALDQPGRDLFASHGQGDRADAVWTLERQAQVFIYDGRWSGGRLRVEFDLSNPVEAPPGSWFEQPIR
jgi:hypothetical protein